MRRAPVILTVLSALATPAWAALQQQGGQASGTGSSAPTVNLNTATAQQLESLPGIGARTAQRIIEYRQKNGPFKKVEDLMNVRGIGEKNLLRLKPLLTIGAPPAERTAAK